MAAVLSVVVSLLVALIVTSDLLDLPFVLGLGFTEALALAGILSLSSLGLVAKVLADDGHLKEPIGLKMFTIVTIAEVIALLVVGFTIGEHHDLTALNVLILLAKMLGFVVVTWVLSAKLLPPAILFLRRFIRVPELSFGLLLGGLFLVVVGAEEIGLHGTIGALLFGAALSGLPEGVRHDILPGMRSASEGLFVPGDHGAELRRRMGRAASSRLRGGRRWKGGGNRVDAKGAFGSGEGTDDEDAAGSAAHAGAACLSG